MSKLLSQEAVRTGIMVAMRLEGPILCPFFACCDGVVVFSADGAIETFPAGQAYGARAIYDVIAESGVERLICGFIAEPCRDPLRARGIDIRLGPCRSEEHTSELQSLMRISYAVFCLKKKNNTTPLNTLNTLLYTPNKQHIPFIN